MRFDAKTSGDLAVTQLKGLKTGGRGSLAPGRRPEYVSPRSSTAVWGLPAFYYCFLISLWQSCFRAWSAGSSLLAYFAEDLLSMTTFGGDHRRCRASRRIPPAAQHLSASGIDDASRVLEPLLFLLQGTSRRSLLLSDVPALLPRTSQTSPVFRDLHAVACIGNLLFHFIRDIHFVGEMGLWKAVVGGIRPPFTPSFSQPASVSRKCAAAAAPGIEGHGSEPACCRVYGYACFFCILSYLRRAAGP